MVYWDFINVLNILHHAFRYDYKSNQNSALDSEHVSFRDLKMRSRVDLDRKRQPIISFPDFQADISAVQIS